MSGYGTEAGVPRGGVSHGCHGFWFCSLDLRARHEEKSAAHKYMRHTCYAKCHTLPRLLR